MTDALATYTIRVHGHLDDHWSARLGGAELRRLGDGTTSLTIDGDQAHLHGVLAGLRDIGAVLLDLHTSSRPDQAHPAAGAETPCGSGPSIASSGGTSPCAST